MQTEIQRKPLAKEAHFAPPVLFPQATQHHTELEQRAYLKEELIKLAQAGTLCVTDIMNQPQGVGDACGMIILGQIFREGRMESEPVPSVLEEYLVKLRPLAGRDEVAWKSGRESIGTVARGQGKVELFQDVYEYAKPGPDGTVSLRLPIAWKALRQYGANCRKCRRVSARPDVWRFEEVRPQQQETADAALPPSARRRVRDAN